MLIREYSELTDAQRRRAPGVDFSEGDPPSVAGRIDGTRVRGRRYLGYSLLYAVERGVPLAHLGSTRVSFVPARGDVETVCGITDVITRSDALRRRHATRLLEAAHARARAEGIGWAMLWTHRAWVAHRLYERLGYRDVYSPPLVTRRPSVPRRPGRPGVRLKVARGGDAERIERVYAEASRDRIGFCRRSRGWFTTNARLGWRRPAAYRLAYVDGRLVGYVHLNLDEFDLITREVVVADARQRGPILDALERLAPRRWIGIRSTTFVRDAATALERRGYEWVPYDHAVMMACPLRPVGRSAWRSLTETIADPRFALHGVDMI